MDILKAEIERKRKQLESKDLVGNQKKFFKREDLIKKDEEEYWKKFKAKQGITNQALEHNEASVSTGATSSRDTKVEKILPRKEVIRRLRERNEPIILFGESEYDAFIRLRKLEISEPDVVKGQRNDFQEAMEKVDQHFLQELIKSGTTGDGTSSQKNANDVKVDEMQTTIEEIKDLAKHLGKRKGAEALHKDCDVIVQFIKFLMELWGKNLNSRPEEEKISTQGRLQSATYTQTQSYLRPLLRQLRAHTIAEDILAHLCHIVNAVLERDYVKANDAYLRMAIGNAPWPIGVTMVGIHARTGREKIFASNIAHVLNDETQRKYIQALKRLMTQCQKMFPTDPSRSVEYNAL